MTKQEYFSTMPDQLLCECIKELTGQKEGIHSLNIVFNGLNQAGFFYSQIVRDTLHIEIFEEAAKRYLKIKMLQS